MTTQNTHAAPDLADSTKHTAHTPGPWHHYLGNFAYCVGHGNDRPIARVYSVSESNQAATSPQDEANARLIASAPELLAALEAASLAIRDLSKQLADNGTTPNAGWDAFRRSRAALAKAKGGL